MTPARSASPIELLPSIRLVKGVAYAGTDNPRQALDLYLPKEPMAEKLPAIVYIHGGAWRKGNKRSGARYLQDFLTSGHYIGISIGYRLSGEAIWPAQIHDCKAAIRWIRAHADEYGIDPDRIAVMGSSAGAHLASILGTSSGVEAMEGALGEHLEQRSDVQGVVSFCGPADFLQMNRNTVKGARKNHHSKNSGQSKLIGGPIRQYPDRVRSANPITYITADDPAFLLLHGTEDAIVAIGQSVLMHEALQSAGVPSAIVPIPGAAHVKGFEQVRPIVARFFARQLNGRETEARLITTLNE